MQFPPQQTKCKQICVCSSYIDRPQLSGPGRIYRQFHLKQIQIYTESQRRSIRINCSVNHRSTNTSEQQQQQEICLQPRTCSALLHQRQQVTTTRGPVLITHTPAVWCDQRGCQFCGDVDSSTRTNNMLKGQSSQPL